MSFFLLENLLPVVLTVSAKNDHTDPLIASRPPQNILAYISMSILSFFLLENLLLMVGIGPRAYFTNAFYVLDLVVVSVSLVLEVCPP